MIYLKRFNESVDKVTKQDIRDCFQDLIDDEFVVNITMSMCYITICIYRVSSNGDIGDVYDDFTTNDVKETLLFAVPYLQNICQLEFIGGFIQYSSMRLSDMFSGLNGLTSLLQEDCDDIYNMKLDFKTSYMKGLYEGMKYEEIEDMMEDCRDMLLELSDIGYVTSVHNFDGGLDVRIEKLEDQFTYDDIQDYIERVDEYLKSNGWIQYQSSTVVLPYLQFDYNRPVKYHYERKYKERL